MGVYMISHLRESFRQYCKEWSEADLGKFNIFILKNILRHIFRTESIIPILVVVLVVAVSIQAQRASYIFIPQSSITAYATFLILQLAISLLVIFIYPFLIILLFNYLGYRLPHIIPRIFLPTKVILLLTTFYLCLRFLSHGKLTPDFELMVVATWTSLYFFLMNLYLAQKHGRDVFKTGKFRLILIFIFIAFMIKPFSMILYHTSEIINYMEINPLVFIDNTQCKMLSQKINTSVSDSNLSISNPDLVEHTANGCYLYGNIIRLGFASDYVIIFKKNLQPVTESGRHYNYYTRLNCYSGNCFSEDNIRLDVSNDINAKIIEKKVWYEG